MTSRFIFAFDGCKMAPAISNALGSGISN